MVWREPANHGTDCYFCVINLTGINRKNQSILNLKYHDLQSACRPVAQCDEIPVPVFGEFPDISDEDSSCVEENGEEVILDVYPPHTFPQMELNDLVRNLGLSKSSAELLAFSLKEKNPLSLYNNTRITFYRNGHEEYLRFFYKEMDLGTVRILHSLECHSTNQKI